MLKRIRICGLGPHLDFRAELDPRGPNTVSGPSEAGKTFLLEAVLFALYGRSQGGRFRTDAIHETAQKAVVELTLDSGRTIKRSATRSKVTRSIVLAEEETTYGSEEPFRQALGELGRDPEAIELAMVPMAWVELSHGNARALRDVLSRILPDADLASEVARIAAEQGVTPTAEEVVLDEGKISASRRIARKERDEAQGRLDLARERALALLGTGAPAAPAPPEPELVARVEAWEEADRGAGLALAREQAERAASDWDRRRAVLREQPTVVTDPEAERRVERLRAELQQAFTAGQQAGGQLQMSTMQRQMFTAGVDTCPTCQRPGWTQGAQMVAGIDQQLAVAQQAFEAAGRAAQAAQAALAEAEAGLVHQRQARAEADAWTRSVAALGPRPVVPELSGSSPSPSGERPTAAEVERVRGARAEGRTLDALRQRHAKDQHEADAGVRREEATLAEAEGRCVRYDVLLDAVRRAPSVVAERQSRALGDLGPVTLEFGDNPAVKVLVDGRPWWLASRGRQVVADAWLRSALRRAMQVPWLPLFVDNCQDVGGQPLPELGGPVVFLVTTEGKGIHVRRRVPRETGSTEG